MIAVQQKINALGMPPVANGISAKGYLRKVLQPGELIRFKGRLHWLIYVNPIAWLIMSAGFVAIAFFVGGTALAGLFPAFALLIGGVRPIRALFERLTVQVIATDRRVLVLRGFVSRHTVEMNASKIETVDVDQTALGRILNFGTATIRGTGTTIEPINLVDHPLELRSAITAS